MRVVFVASRSPDYQSASIFRGLNEILGIGSVLDTHGLDRCVWPYYLHEDMDPPAGETGNTACEAIGQMPGTGVATRWAWGARREPFAFFDADLVVLNYSSWKDTQSWATAEAVLSRIKPGYKLAYVCGDDHVGGYPELPPISSGASAIYRFHREGSPRDSVRLGFAAPADWSCPSTDRPIDAIFAGAVNNDARRRAVGILGRLATEHWHRIIIATGERPLPWGLYMELLRRSKLAMCPVGAANCRDTMRHHEAAASGCTVVDAEDVTVNDLFSAMKAHDPVANAERFLKTGTTAVRARQLLDACRCES